MTTEQAVEEYLRRKRGEQQIPAAGPYEPVDTLSTEDAVEEYMRRRRAAPPPTLFVPPSRQPDLQQVATQQPPRRRQPTPPVAGETDPRWASRGRRGGLGASMAKVGGGMIEALGHVAESYERGGRPTSEVLAEMGVRAAAPSLLKPGDLLQAAYKSATEKILPEAERGRIGRFLLGGEPPEEERRGPRVGPALQRTGRAIREDPRFAEVSEAEVGEVGGFDVEGGAQWDIDWLIQRGAGQLVQFGVQLAVLKATKGRSAPAQFAAFAAPTVIQEGGGAIGETKAKLASRVARGELTQEEADAIAEGVGTVVGLGAFVLERIPYAGVLLKKNKAAQRVFQNAMLRGVQRLGARLTGETAETMVGRMAGRAVGGFTSEGAEELGQEAWSDVVAYLSRTDPQAFRDWQKRYGEAGALGGLIGGPAAVVTGTREDIAQKRLQQSLAQQLERIAKLDEEIQNRVAAGEDKPKVISEVYAREGFPPALVMAAIEEAVGQEAVEAVAAAPVTPEPVVPEAPPAAPAAPTIATEPVPPLPVPPAPSSPAEAIPVPSEPVAVSPLDEALAELPEIPAPPAAPPLAGAAFRLPDGRVEIGQSHIAIMDRIGDDLANQSEYGYVDAAGNFVDEDGAKLRGIYQSEQIETPAPVAPPAAPPTEVPTAAPTPKKRAKKAAAAVPAPPVTPIRESVAHRGYLIRYNPIGQEWWIEKDRQRISSATSEQDARATIDQLTAPAEPAVAEVAAVPARAPAPAPVGEDIFFGLTEDGYNALGEQVEQELKTPAPKWKRLQDGTHEAVVEGRTVTLTKEGTGEDAYWEAAIDGVADPNTFETLAEAKSGIRDGLREELVTAEIKRRAEARRPAAPAAAAKPAPKKGRRPKGEKAAPAVPSLVEAATAPTKPATKPAAPAPSRPLARQTLPTREEALDLARQTYERGHPEAAMVRVRRFMDGYDDAVAGKDRKVKEAGPYTDAYNMVRRAIRQQEEGGQAASETEFVADEELGQEATAAAFAPTEDLEVTPGQQVTGAHDSLPLQRVREKSTGKVWWQKTPGAGGTKHGVMSFLRRRVPTPAPAEVPAIPAGTNPGNADRSVSILVAVQNAITSPLASIEKMYNFISYALGGETDVPLGPEAAVKRVNNPQIVVEQLRPAEGGAGDAKRRQIKDAQTGLAEAKHTGDRYRDGLMTTNATTKFFLWGFLSRELNVAAQEAGFLDAIAGGVNKYIDAAIAGQFDAAMLDDYLKWAKTVFPEGSFGAQAQKNLNQFGELFLLKLSQPVAPEILAEIYTTLPVPTEPMNGLALLHDMIATPDHFSSRKLRRDFHRFATGVGVQNKVLSFVLLVAGRTDVLVLDRVRIDAEYNTGIYGSYNLYGGVSELGPNGKKQRIKGTGLAEIFDGVRGLLFYEMLEDAYSQVLPGVYAELGRPEHASLASYHWETWVIDSGQEVDHGTTSAIVREAAGDPRPYESVVVREGQYDKFAYGALYQYKDGKPLILYPLQEGGRTDYVEMTLPQWRAFLFELQRQQNRANITGERVVPNGFSIEQAARVTDEFRDLVTGEPLAQPQPWYDDERVSWRALDILARRHGTAHERRAVTPEDETAGAHGARRAHRGIRGTRTPEPTPGELVQSEATAAYPDEDLPEKLTQKMVEWYGDEADYTVHGVPTIADRVRAIARGARGSLYIIGKKVTGSVQLAKLMRAFRDSRFEHGHVLLLNDAGRIVYHSIDTSGSVEQVTGRRDRFQHIVATAKRLGVTRVVLVHNHPSGNTQASRADLLFHENWSRRLAQEGLSLEMDLILNHTEVGVVELNNRYEPTGRRLKVTPPKGQEQDWTQQPLDVATHTTSAIARIVTGTVTRDAEGNWVHGRPQAPGFGQVFIVFLDARNQILAVGPSDARSLTRSPERLSWLDDSMTQLGASKIAILTNNEASPGSYHSISMAMDGFIARYNRRVLDVADVSETGMVRASARVRGHMTNDVFRQVLPAIASTEMEIQAEGGETFTAEEGDGSAPPDPRVADLQSLDPVTRVVAALKIGAGKEKKTRDEIALALLAAQSPDVLAALHATAPHGRGTYRSEQVLKAIRPALAKHTDAVISPEEILRQLSRSLNVPILATGKRWGSLRAAGAQGAYRQGSRVVRIASAGDIETAGHEIGHFVHELVHGIAKNNQLDVSGIDPAHRAELVKLVTKSSGVFVTKQSGAKVREGVAEFFRRYITNPEDAQLRASGYYDFVTQELEAKHPAVYRALMQARSQFELWRTGTDTARILAKIHSAAEVDPGNPNRTPWDRFMEQIVNDLHYVKKIEDRLLGKDAPPEARVTARAALLRGAGGAADLWIRNGQYDWRSRQKIGDSLFTILKPIFEGGSRDLFTAYIVARRMRYLIRQKDKDVGMDIGTVERVIAQTETEQFIAAFDQLTQYNLNLLNMLRDSGVLAENDYLEIIKDPEAVANYVPFHRVKEKGANARGREQGLFLSKAVVKRFGGGTADIVDPLESIVKNTYAFTHAAMQQQVNSAFVDLMSQEGAGVFGNIITPKSEKTDVNVAEIWDQLDAEMGGALGTMPDELKKVYLRIFRPGDFFGTANVISVLQANEVTGKSERIWYEVTDNDLYKAVTGMNRDDLKLWQRLASYPSAWRRAGATLSPEFLIRNPIRDQMSAWINSEYGYVPIYDLGRGILALFRQGDMYERWKASGGEYSTLVDLDRKGLQRKLSELEPSGPMSAGKAAMFVPNVVKNIYHALQALSALMENGTRMGEFIRAFETEISRGTVSEVAMARAGNAARRITTDFGQHGSKTKALRAVATFWNAGLQGETRTIEAFKKNPVRASLIAFGAITLPSLFFLAANWDDEEYWEIPQWQRDLFWLMKVPDFVPDFLQQTEESGAAGQWFKPFISSKEGVWLRLPKPFGLGQVFGSIPERIAEWVRHDDPHAFAETMKNLVPLSPWASNPLFGGVPDIALVQPFFDNATNWSRFLQRPVVPPSAEGVPKTEQYGPRTSEVAKALSQFFAKTKTEKYIPFVGEQIQSPYKLDNLLRSWTAGLGAYGVAVVDPALRATGLAREQPDRMGPKAAKTLADIAGVKALVARSPSWGSESIARFYERYSEVKQAHDLVQKYERSNQPRAAALAARRYQQDLIEYSRLAPIASAIAQLREQSTLADMGPMSPVDKAERIDAHGRLAAELAARATGRPFRVAKIRQHSFTRATVPVE